LIGEIIAEFKGKTTSLRVLPEGKVEASEQGSGSILGVEASILATAVSTPMQDGVALGEGDALVTTVEGDVVRIKKIGVGWPTGRGRGSSRRGVFFHSTESQRLSRLNRVVGLYEYESDEDGDWTAKIWEWK
jgi:hypothetical protein